MKISDLIKTSAAKLRDVDSPELDIRVLLEHVTGKNRAYFIANSDAELHADYLAKFNELLERRIKREPISQILGSREFWGREFKVSRDVLTPRPETELIIEAALKLFPKDKELKILDLGTGSGCILLTLLSEFPRALGAGVDISNSALAIASENAYNLGIDRARFILSEWCENVEPGRFDLIVSNPPYIALHERERLDKELEFEPDTALFSGDDGLNDYRKIAAQLHKFEFEKAIFEIGHGQEDEVRKIFAEHGYKCSGMLKDLAGIIRTIIFDGNYKG